PRARPRRAARDRRRRPYGAGSTAVRSRPARPGAPRPSSASGPLAHRPGDAGDRLVDRDTVVLRPVAEPEGDRPGLGVLTARDEHEGHLLGRRGADLLAEAV